MLESNGQVLRIAYTKCVILLYCKSVWVKWSCFYSSKTKKNNFENMSILEKIASPILSFEKMSPIDKEKLKIAEETHYKLQKTKRKLHTITAYKNGGVNRVSIYR